MKNLLKIALVAVLVIAISFSGCTEQTDTADTESISEQETTADSTLELPVENDGRPEPGLDSEGNEIGVVEELYTFDSSPVSIIRENVSEFTLPNGETHWYETIYLPEAGVNWIQAKNLAIEAGGYLVSINSDEENDFVFSLIDDEKYWFTWEETSVMNGPFIGAYQPVDSTEPDGGWKWISGEEWTYTNWAVDGMEGDEDPRPNDQPNNVNGNQNVVCFGEITIRVSTWGDFPQKMSSYNDSNEAKVYGFIIEYDEEPEII